MLQVLCQLLGTSNLEDVQSWLVSASPSGLISSNANMFYLNDSLLFYLEKDQARTMINSALRGLKESDRTTNTNQSVDLNSLSNFVEK